MFRLLPQPMRTLVGPLRAAQLAAVPSLVGGSVAPASVCTKLLSMARCSMLPCYPTLPQQTTHLPQVSTAAKVLVEDKARYKPAMIELLRIPRDKDSIAINFNELRNAKQCGATKSPHHLAELSAKSSAPIPTFTRSRPASSLYSNPANLPPLGVFHPRRLLSTTTVRGFLTYAHGFSPYLSLPLQVQ